MDEDEQFLLQFHAEHHGAIPIYLYVPRRGERLWVDLTNRQPIEFKPFTKEWAKERSRIRTLLSDLKNPKKGGSRKKWREYVFEHLDEVKDFIC